MDLLAIDLGADSGRVIRGTVAADGTITYQEGHRFPNGGVRAADGSLRWDIEALWTGILEGLRQDAARGPVAGIAVDTWGVDYGLVDEHGTLLSAPYHYRDARNDGVADTVHARFGRQAWFERTALRSLSFNTVFQVLAHQRQHPEELARAHRLLTIPDLLAYRLSGVMANEWTNAGTTALTVPGTPRWNEGLIQELGLPRHLFGPIVTPGTVLGPLQSSLTRQLGFTTAPAIIAPGAHDTASAFAALEDDGPGSACISCGTWSIMGVIRDTPLTTPAALAADLSNEIHIDGRIRLLKNIMGLWVWQEVRRDRLAEGLNASHADLAALAAAAAPATGPAFDINALTFQPPSAPGNRMLDRVRTACEAQGLDCATDGALFRRITEALATAYSEARRGLEAATGVPITRLTILGGGIRNRLLVELTRQATGIPVAVGDPEATAYGNLRVQARALATRTARA